MLAVDQDKTDRSIGEAIGYLGSVLAPLISLAGSLGPWRYFYRLRDKAERSAQLRELNLQGDYYLDDVGIRRSVDRRADDLVQRLRLGG